MVVPQIGEAFGQERVVQRSCEALTQAGHEVFLVADRQVGEFPPHAAHLLIPGLSSFHMLSARAAVRSALTRFGAFLQSAQPHAVHFHDVFDPRFFHAAGKKYPTFLTAHTVAATCPSSARLTENFKPCTYSSGWGCLRHHRSQGCLSFKSDLHRAHAIAVFIQRRWALRRYVHRVFAISEYVKNTLLADGWPAEKVQMLLNPVDIAPVQPLPHAPAGLLVYAARLTPLKGLEDLLCALPHVREREWTLWVCGEGSERASLEKLTQNLHLDSRVHFLGRTEPVQTARIFASARAVIAPNRGPEAFGLSVAEACAQGVPVIASNVPAMNELIVAGETGYLFQAGSSGSLAAQIDLLFEQKEKARAMAAEAQRRVVEKYSIPNHLTASLQAYGVGDVRGEARLEASQNVVAF